VKTKFNEQRLPNVTVK